MGMLELPDPQRRRPGERALLVAEQLAFEQFVGERRAIDFDQRARPARRSIVNGARDEFFPDAAFTANEDGDVAVGDALDHQRDLPHRLARAPDQEGLRFVVGDLAPKRRDFGDQPVLFDRLFDGRFERNLAEPLGIVRFHHVVHGAEADGFHDRRRVVAAREHDHLDNRCRRPSAASAWPVRPCRASSRPAESHRATDRAVRRRRGPRRGRRCACGIRESPERFSDTPQTTRHRLRWR